MKTKLLPCRILAGFVGVYHITLGFLIFFSGDLAIKIAKSFAGITITGSPELGAIGEVLACYIIAFGLMMGLAAWNPIKNRSMITIGLILFILRLFQRIIFAGKTMEIFQISATSYWTAFIVVLIISVTLGFFRLMIYRDMK